MDHYQLEMAVAGIPPIPSWGTALHGALMEKLPNPWPEVLHQEGVRPFSQWVEVKSEDRFIWHINSLDDDLSAVLEEVFGQDPDIGLRQYDAQLSLSSMEKKHLSLAEYMKGYFLSAEPCNGLFLTFRTPATHRTEGRYAAFPSEELIARSLCSRLCAVDAGFALADEQALEQVIERTKIYRYKLESARYKMAEAGVIGYTGRIELRFFGPDPLKRLAGALFGFAEWSGVGIKTALGMGGCTIKSIGEIKQV